MPRTNPLRAFGRLVPEVLLSSTGAGGGAFAASAAGRGMSGARMVRMAKVEALEAGQTVEGQRTAGTMSTKDWAVPEWLAEAAKKVPAEWGVALPNRDGIGFRWFDHSDTNGVRVDEGEPGHEFPSQRHRHVLVRADGQVVARDGGTVAGRVSESPDRAHVPLEEWMEWSTWKTP